MTKTLTAAFAALLLASASPLPLQLSLGPTPAVAQGVVTYENLGFKGEFGAITIPKITIEGTTATKAEIEGLFDPKRTSDVGQRASRISARSISIPSIEVRQTTPDGDIVTVYRDTVMRNVQNGVITEGVTPSMVIKGKIKGAASDAKIVDLDMTAANMVLKGFDLGFMLRAFFEKGQPNEPMKVAAVEQSIGRITINIGPDLKMAMASASIRDFKMRALERPFMEAMAEAQQNEKTKAPDWEKKNLALMTPIMTMMGIGTMEVNGMTSEFADPAAKTKGTFALDRITATSNSLIPEKFALQGLRVNAMGSTVNFGEISFDGLDLSSTYAAMASLGGANAADFDPAAAIPKLNLVRFAGIDIDVPDTKSPNQRVKAKLGLFETKMANHVGSIPANIDMTLNRFQMDIPANTKEKGLKDILALGYKALDVSARYNQVWEEATRTLKLTDFTISSAGMFSATAKAEIGNVVRDLFTTDKAKAAVAALAVAAKSIDVSLTNSSLFERLIAQQAKEQRRKPEDVRAELAAGASLMVPMMLGDHPAARMLGPILGKFVADPKNLKLTVTAKDPVGVGATDFIAAANPMDVLKKVDIKASANE
jgi:hypothetical protein